MASLRLAVHVLGLAAVGRSMTIRGSLGENRTEIDEVPGWIRSVSYVLPVEGFEDPARQTAIVTFAGKKNVEYIDGAVMLGLSVQKHLPGYPMVALTVVGMQRKNKALLRHAGWTLVDVPNWDREYCGEGCDMEFLGRWHDSFEKINAFRLPFGRVLFFDSDTYIFSGSVQDIVNTVELPHGHILMAKDGCKADFNSGVMLYRPDLDVFASMLKLVSQRSREQILDQNLINEVYRGKVVEMDSEYNCVDTLGFQPGLDVPCKIHCSKNTAVAHFTGHPKPTSATRRLLELVRRPGSPAIACTNTNFGSCQKWSEYYCDIRQHSHMLSKPLQSWLHRTGECCHSPFDPARDSESCKECPTALTVQGAHPLGEVEGTYLQTNITSGRYNGGKPIYVKRPSGEDSSEPMYMYFVQKQVLWLIGHDYKDNRGVGIAYIEAQCPRDAGGWKIFNGTDFVKTHVSVRPLDREDI